MKINKKFTYQQETRHKKIIYAVLTVEYWTSNVWIYKECKQFIDLHISINLSVIFNFGLWTLTRMMARDTQPIYVKHKRYTRYNYPGKYMIVTLSQFVYNKIYMLGFLIIIHSNNVKWK